LAMDLLHNGRPPVIRSASYTPQAEKPLELPTTHNLTEDLCRILGSYNVASKEWIIRQYDHEVQGGSVVKPLVGVECDGPSDAAIVRPVLDSRRGVVISCGMNPRYGEFDTYDMAATAIDEAMRNCVAVGADPNRIALLDNFCWGDCEKSETLGSLVRAALACHDLSIALGAPFISGKDSLNNEFSYVDAAGTKQTIAIPPSLLISAMGQIDDVGQAVTMDLKRPDSLIYIVGVTKNELGGSHFTLIHDLTGGKAPTVDAKIAKQTFAALHSAIKVGLVRSCHDLSEGGLAVAIAEMCFAGGIGAEVELSKVPISESSLLNTTILFSESNTRFLCEVASEHADSFESKLAGIPFAYIGRTQSNTRLKIVDQHDGTTLIESEIATLKAAWKKPLAW
jgi:phosphoribosylformylglycinamidine synthase subunit PurSL